MLYYISDIVVGPVAVVDCEEAWGKCCPAAPAAVCQWCDAAAVGPAQLSSPPACRPRGRTYYTLHRVNMWACRGDDAVKVMTDSKLHLLIFFFPTTNPLRIWNAWIMDRMWMCCRILLFLSVCVKCSVQDGDDASCDGAFDIYFVLDRWVNADLRARVRLKE